MTARIFSTDPSVRREAIEQLPLDVPAHRYALRHVLRGDADATLRALAAEQLGKASGAPNPAPWLREALLDPYPSVRDAAARALAKLCDRESAPALRRLVAEEPVWWVRRTVVYSLAAVAGTDAIDPLVGALDDPFWRTRFAAVQALSAFPVEQVRARARALGLGPAGEAALAFLEGKSSVDLSPGIEAPRTADDPDPAVVTERIAEVPAQVLPELLADSHEALRRAATERLRALNDSSLFIAGLKWFEEPRIPYASDATRTLLDSLADDARPVVEAALQAGPGARAWALQWIAATGCEELASALHTAIDDADARVRLVAAAAVEDDASLIKLLADTDEQVRSSAVQRLADSGTLPARRALRKVAAASLPAVARAALVHTAATEADEDWLRSFLDDPHATVRALAVQALGPGAVPNADQDTDPLVRAATLDLATAPAALDDTDPLVKRTAADLLVNQARSLDAAQRSALADTLSRDADPWLRIQACALDPSNVTRLLELACDDDLGVRAAAREPLDALPDRDTQLQRALAGELSAPARAAAWAHRLLPVEESRRPLLRQALESPVDRAAVEAVAAAYGELEVAKPERKPRQPRVAKAPRVVGPRRLLGATGIEVSPLGISGANEPPVGAFAHAAEAGVNLWFWEPRYRALTQYLRGRQDEVIVAGTYNAAGPDLERDLHRALKHLRRDHIDVFLLFWTRSPARVEARAFEVLARLRAQGKIRAFGFSTHHRDIAAHALESHPWPVLMTRHSAAYPGAEEKLLPLALEKNTAVLTFTALCYGRLLRAPHGAPEGLTAPTATECYRYTLSQPGVSACWSAPRWHRELTENLEVLANPTLDPESQERLRSFGRLVRAEGQRFTRLVRRGSGDTREAGRALALALLEENPVPEEAAAGAFGSK